MSAFTMDQRNICDNPMDPILLYNSPYVPTLSLVILLPYKPQTHTLSQPFTPSSLIHSINQIFHFNFLMHLHTFTNIYVSGSDVDGSFQYEWPPFSGK